MTAKTTSGKSAPKNAELIEKMKADEAAKKADAAKQAELEAMEKAEAERIAAEQAKIDPNPTELSPEAKAEAERIAAAEADEVDEATKARQEQLEKSETAYRKILAIATDFSEATPDSHPVFGRADIIFTLGDLRDLMGLRRP